jgi:hypothetical protein
MASQHTNSHVGLIQMAIGGEQDVAKNLLTLITDKAKRRESACK